MFFAYASYTYSPQKILEQKLKYRKRAWQNQSKIAECAQQLLYCTHMLFSCKSKSMHNRLDCLIIYHCSFSRDCSPSRSERVVLCIQRCFSFAQTRTNTLEKTSNSQSIEVGLVSIIGIYQHMPMYRKPVPLNCILSVLQKFFMKRGAVLFLQGMPCHAMFQISDSALWKFQRQEAIMFCIILQNVHSLYHQVYTSPRKQNTIFFITVK